MGGRINMKQSLKKPTVKNKKSMVVRAMTQSFLSDSKGNITVFINRRKKKLQSQSQQQQQQQQPLQGFDELPATATTTTVGPSRTLRMKRLLWILIIACVCWLIFYANAEHSLRAHSAKFTNNNNSSSHHAESGTDHKHQMQEGAEQAAGQQLADEAPQYYEGVQNTQEEADSTRNGKYLSLARQHKLGPAPLKFITAHQQHSGNKKQYGGKNSNAHHSQSKKQPHHLVGAANNASQHEIYSNSDNTEYNLFVIYTKENYELHTKFELFTRSLFKYATVHLHLHVITDRSSKGSVEDVLQKQMHRFHRNVVYTLYDVAACAERLVDIVATMRPYFSAAPKSYYGAALFYLSLGLHRIADEHLDRVILLDCDIVFRADVRELFAEFDRFSEEHLFGLAPELTPVYRHILYRYRVLFPGTNFGNPYYPMPPPGAFNDDDKSVSISVEEQARLKRRVRHGYPGLNSGVVLLHLERIRASKFYNEQLLPVNVQRITTKYSFRGHLGDQDFFTLFGYEFPHLIYRLDCVWNRQLCTWWKNHGYSEVFDAYFNCEGKVRIYHGNCNTRIPE